MEPLFDKACGLKAWLHDGRNIFSPRMQWVAVIINGHAWSAPRMRWLGPILGGNMLDRQGRPVLWTRGKPVRGTSMPSIPATPAFPAAPAIPAFPAVPAWPAQQAIPTGGWSSLTVDEWLAQ